MQSNQIQETNGPAEKTSEMSFLLSNRKGRRRMKPKERKREKYKNANQTVDVYACRPCADLDSKKMKTKKKRTKKKRKEKEHPYGLFHGRSIKPPPPPPPRSL